MPATKAELCAFCRQRYGADWYASPAKASRLEEARVALNGTVARVRTNAACVSAAIGCCRVTLWKSERAREYVVI